MKVQILLVPITSQFLMKKILSGELLTSFPMADSVSKLSPYENRGHLYLPLPYARHCKIRERKYKGMRRQNRWRGGVLSNMERQDSV
jgi:hypothetical protein